MTGLELIARERACLDAIIEECERKEAVVQTICPHAQFCGDFLGHYFGNAQPEKFLCRKNMLAHKRFDGLVMVRPYTDSELTNAFKRYCAWAYGETCSLAGNFAAELDRLQAEKDGA